MYRAESRVEHGSIHAFPLKKGEGMRKGRMFFIDTQTRKISPLGQSRLLLPLGRNDKEGIILRDPFDCAALAMPPPLRSG